MEITDQLWTNVHLQKIKSIGGEEGKNSDVWIAFDTQISDDLVLKEISKESLEKQNIEDYFLEAKVLNKGKHPHIMPIRYAAEDDACIYITMPYYEKGSIHSIMTHNMLKVREIIKYSLDFLSGLLYIHIKGLTHLDIKPTNIIINNQDRALLTDFGLSRFLENDGFAHQPMQYTFHRSPESYITTDRTVLDDIFQSGAALYRMCNGPNCLREEFEELVQKHSHQQEEWIKDIEEGKYPEKKYLPHIPLKLRKVINKAMHHDPNQRYQNTMELINALSKIDENLDWEYNFSDTENKHLWSLTKENGTIIKITCEYEDGMWVSSGERITSKQNSQIKDFYGQFENIEQAFRHLEIRLAKKI